MHFALLFLRLQIICMSRVFLVCFIAFLFSCDNNGVDTDPSIAPVAGPSIPAPHPITFKIDAVYPHDSKAFTQGLQFYKGKLYESTGLNDQSSLRVVDIKSGRPEKNHVITDPSIFGEGITIFNNKIFQLTWVNKKVFVYNVNNITKPIQTLNWPREGWGITNDGKSLIISDGTDKLYIVNHDSSKSEFQLQKIISVSDNSGPVDSLNELEYINGYLYSNVWFTNNILKIDLSNGHVVGTINFAGLLYQYAKGTVEKETDVLNGIAYDSASNKLYITGKNWPKLFEISLN